MDFHVRLKYLRQKYKLTQSDLADKLGVKSTAISNYESKRNEPSFEKLIVLSKYFMVSSDYLLGVTDSFLPTCFGVIDEDFIDFFKLYQRLDKEGAIELNVYVKYLLYKQENASH